MGCGTWNKKLDAYFDGELAADESQSLGQHLRECPACATDGLARVQLKLAVRAAGQRFAPNSSFRSSIERMIAPRRSSAWGRGWLPALAAAAIVVIAGAWFLIRDQARSQRQLLGELTDLHVATLASSNPVDVVSTDRHTVKPWFEGKIPFSFNLPDLGDSSFTLVGGKVAYLQRSPGAEMIFRIRQHQISLFIFQQQSTGNAPLNAESQSVFSFHFVSWTHNGLRYFLVGDVDIQDMNRLSQLLKDAG
jgi:anti-sigma factor RsiW